MDNPGGTCSLCSIELHRIKDFKQVSDINADPWTSLPRRQSCPLFESLLSPTCISPDMMHTKHLGTDKRLLGSVAWVLIMQVMDQGSVEDRLFVLLQELKDAFFDSFQFSCFLLSFSISYFVVFPYGLLFLIVGWIVRAIRKCGRCTNYMAAFRKSHLVADFHGMSKLSCFLQTKFY